jgi:spermidine synthase
MPNARNRTPWLVFFTLGFTAQLAQLVLLRELFAAFQGNEVTFAVVFGAWLFWGACGTLLARWDAQRRPATPEALALRARGSFALATVLLAFVLPLELFGVRMLRPFCGAIAGSYVPLPGLVAGALLLFAPVGLCLGAQFVCAARAIRNPTRVYFGEAAGSAAAGLLLSLFLVPVLNPFGTAYVATSVSLLMAAWFLRPEEEPGAAVVEPSHFPHFQHSRRPLLHAGLFTPLLALALLSAICLAASRVPDAFSRELFWKAVDPAAHLVANVESPYGDFAVLSKEGRYRVYQNGRLVYTLPDQGESDTLSHLFLAQHPHPERVLLIGGGLSGRLRQALRHRAAHIDYLETDPRLVTVAQPYAGTADFRALSDPRVRFESRDCRRFLRQTRTTFDLMIVSVGDPDTARINRYYTLEFFREAKARLAPGGTLCIGPVTAAAAGQTTAAIRERNATLYWTLKQVFAHVAATPGDTLAFLASDAPGMPLTDGRAVQTRLAARGIQDAGIPRLLAPAALRQVSCELQTGQFCTPRQAGSRAPAVLAPNTDDRPAGYLLSMRMWASIVGDDAMTRLLAACQGNRGVAEALLAALVIGAGLLALGRLRTGSFARPGVLLSMFALGLAGMVACMMVMLAFQNVLGSIYRAVGLMTALLMAGLAMGSEAVRQPEREPAPREARQCLVLAQVVFALFLAALPSLLRLPAMLPSPVAQHAVFGLAYLVTGLLLGAAYPLAHLSGGENDGVAPYAADLIGGSAGAMLVAVVVLPLFGFTVACYACTALVMTAAFLTDLPARRGTQGTAS